MDQYSKELDEVRLVFWGKYIDTYMADTLQRYEECSGMPVKYVLVEEKFTRRNANGGQAIKRSSQMTILEQRTFNQQASRILEENHDAVHLFLSFWGDKRLFRVLLQALQRGKRVAVVYESSATVPLGYWKDEPRLLSHLKILGRRIAYRLLWPLIKFVSRGPLPGVLAVSPLAQEQLRKAGFPQEVIFPYGYFVEHSGVEPKQRTQADTLRILFSGSLIRRKGLDIAIAAVKQVNSAAVKVLLDIYGAGDIKKYLTQDSPDIRYRGIYPQEQAQQIISGYDLLLVPSRHEGWGLVVNEALMQGVPVLASDRVGAKCLLEASGAGMVFRSGDAAQLASLLAGLVADRHELRVMAAACSGFVECITPSIGADYLSQVLDFYFDASGQKPEAYWLNAQA